MGFCGGVDREFVESDLYKAIWKLPNHDRYYFYSKLCSRQMSEEEYELIMSNDSTKRSIRLCQLSNYDIFS